MVLTHRLLGREYTKYNALWSNALDVPGEAERSPRDCPTSWHSHPGLSPLEHDPIYDLGPRSSIVVVCLSGNLRSRAFNHWRRKGRLSRYFFGVEVDSLLRIGYKRRCSRREKNTSSPKTRRLLMLSPQFGRKASLN